jgi:hypothetical protein
MSKDHTRRIWIMSNPGMVKGFVSIKLNMITQIASGESIWKARLLKNQ